MIAAPYPYLLLLLPVAVLTRDDLRTRRVGAGWLAALGAASVAAGAWTVGWRTMLLQAGVNAALLLLTGAMVAGYLRLRRLRVRTAFGGGDAAFLLSVAPLFGPAAFLRYMIAASLVALVWWAACRPRRRTVPFVAMAGLALGGWIALQFLGLWL